VSVRRLLLVVPSLEYGSVAAQAVELALALPAGEFERRVFVLGRVGPWAEKLTRAGVEVDAPGRGRMFDLRPLARLRALAREYAPDAVHVFGMRALRVAVIAGFTGRLVVSPCPRQDFDRSWLRRLDSWLLRRAAHVVAFGETEAERCRSLGAEAARLVTVNPAVSAEPETGEPVGWKRYLLCVGPLQMHKGFQDAVWGFDIIRYIHPDLHLVLVGEGPDRGRLPVFIDGLKTTGFVHFTGQVAEVLTLLRGAEMLWSPGRVETGTQAVLEAMAAGVPVVASRFPRLAELVVDGVTGFLVPAEDKAMLARRTQELLTDPALRRRMGEAGKVRAEDEFSPARVAETCARLYKG
jgi:glycosyltransferase involved in cell wall biosynthesis